MPTDIDILYRYIKHDEPNTKCPAYWNVSAGSIDTTHRLYRIMYKENEITYEQEITIHIHKYKKELKDYASLLEIVMTDTRYCDSFKNACFEMACKDPWIRDVAPHFLMYASP